MSALSHAAISWPCLKLFYWPVSLLDPTYLSSFPALSAPPLFCLLVLHLSNLYTLEYPESSFFSPVMNSLTYNSFPWSLNAICTLQHQVLTSLLDFRLGVPAPCFLWKSNRHLKRIKTKFLISATSLDLASLPIHISINHNSVLPIALAGEKQE